MLDLSPSIQDLGGNTLANPQSITFVPETLDEQLDHEAAEQSICFESEDVREGLAAVRERRKPSFRGV